MVEGTEPGKAPWLHNWLKSLSVLLSPVSLLQVCLFPFLPTLDFLLYLDDLRFGRFWDFLDLISMNYLGI